MVQRRLLLLINSSTIIRDASLIASSSFFEESAPGTCQQHKPPSQHGSESTTVRTVCQVAVIGCCLCRKQAAVALLLFCFRFIRHLGFRFLLSLFSCVDYCLIDTIHSNYLLCLSVVPGEEKKSITATTLYLKLIVKKEKLSKDGSTCRWRIWLLV